MIPVDSALLFFTASTLLALTPGPDNIFVLTQSALYGKKAGIILTLGLCTGLVVHTAAVACGVAALIMASSVAFTALKVAGAIYLVYLAWQVFTSSSNTLSSNKVENPTPFQLYRRGIVMNATNPKVSIFFLAFLPQFVDVEQGAVTVQIMLLGILFMISTLIVFGLIALLAGAIGAWLERSQRAQIYLNRVAGCIFLGLAANLTMTSR